MGFPQNIRRSRKILEGHDHFFFWLYLHQACFVSNFMGKVVGLTTLNILRTTRAMLMNFDMVNTPTGQILIWGSKVFYLFLQICIWIDYSKKWTDHEIKSVPHPQPPSSPLSYSGVIRMKVFLLKHWVFLDDIWNFNKS